MLQLTHDQVALLGAGARERFVRGLAPALAPLWPAVAQRLGSRLDSFVELAVEHAQRYGLASGATVATYVNLWFLWGPRFEEQAGFEWAREILADPRRDERGRTYPLVAATLDRLQRRDASRPAPSAEVLRQFVASQRAVEARFSLSSGLDVAAERPAPRPVTGLCDVDRIEVALASKDGAGIYTRSPQGWTFGPAAAAAIAPLVVEAGADHDEALRFVAVAPSRGTGAPARLRVRMESAQRCRVQQHPRVGLTTPDGERQWRGLLDIDAEVSAPPAPAEPPPIAAGGGPARHHLDVQSCGVRVDGVPLGSAGIGIEIYPSAQWLREVRHGACGSLSLPPGLPQGHAPAAAAGGIDCRIECDGKARDAGAMRRGFERLRLDFAAAMNKLLGAWAATAGVERATLQVTAGLLEGVGSFAWGWRIDGDSGGAGACLAVGADLRMAACAIDLTLEGELAVAGARARIALKSAGRTELNFSLDRRAQQVNLEEAMGAAQARFRFPFSLHVDTQASPSLAVIGQAAAVTGALAGACGLRPWAGGYEWFFEMKVEPVSTVVAVSDPVLGRSELPRPLLPAVPLVTWNLR